MRTMLRMAIVFGAACCCASLHGCSAKAPAGTGTSSDTAGAGAPIGADAGTAAASGNAAAGGASAGNGNAASSNPIDAGTRPSSPGADASASGAAGAAGTGGNLADASTELNPPSPCGVFPAVKDLTMNGSFTSTNAAEGTNCQIYRPTTLGDTGVKHPIILWGNGTGGPTTVYAAAFEYWVSHGFIVAAGNSSNGQGSGAEMLGCLDYLMKQNTTKGSVYEGKICSRVGASGHSQGGGGAIMAGVDTRLTATAPLMPYIQQGFGGFDQASITKQHGPMLLLSGTSDTIAVPAQNQQPVFDTTNVPVFWANLMGGDHVAVSLNGITTYRNVMLAWYRYHLMGDEAFHDMFYGKSCKLCGDSTWIVMRKSIN